LHVWQNESEAVLQVSCEAQFATSVQIGQESATPFIRYEPVAHCVHCVSVAVEQV
jgi:hypothetical protein